MSVFAELADGRRLEFPDGTNPAVVQMTVKKMMGGGGAPEPQKPDESFGDAMMIGAGKAFTRLGQGAQQAYYGATGDTEGQNALKAKVADEEKLYQPLANARPMATGLGEAAPVLAGGPLTMGAAGALEYGTPQEKTLRGAAGVTGGVVGKAAGLGLGRLIQPVRGAVDNSIAELLAKYKMQGLPGQVSGNVPTQWLTSVLSNLPGGGSIRDVVASQRQGLNKAAMATAGSAADAVTPETVAAAKAATGPKFDQATAGQVVDINRDVAKKLLNVESEHLKNLSPDQRTIVTTYIDDILAHGEGGMPGDVYQKARSRIAARARSTQDSELKTALTGIYRTLDQAFAESAAPEASALMNTARKEWSSSKTLEKMATDSGDISAARLSGAAKTLPPQMRELATLGTIMKPLNDSTTAQRLAYQSMLSGGVGAGAGLAQGDATDAMKWGAGSFAAPLLLSKALTSKAGMKYLTEGAAKVTPEMERWLKRIGANSGGLLGLSLAP